MIRTDLSDPYGDYIVCLNKQEWPKLEQFVHDGVCYNGERIGLPGSGLIDQSQKVKASAMRMAEKRV